MWIYLHLGYISIVFIIGNNSLLKVEDVKFVAQSVRGGIIIIIVFLNVMLWRIQEIDFRPSL